VLLSKLSYFDNVNASMSPALLAAIHETIKENEGYATVIWRSRKDDALDATLHQAIRHYSREKGELRNYIISTMKTILKNVLRNESSMEDETLHFHVDSKSTEEEEELSDVDIMLNADSDDIETCVNEFLPHIIDDYDFFSTQKSSKRRGDYYEILTSYSPTTVVGAMKYIQEHYIPKLEDFMNSRDVWNRQIPTLSYSEIAEKYASKELEYVGIKDHSVLVKGSSAKRMVSVPLDTIATALISELYGSGSRLKKKFFGVTYYKAPNGEVVNSKDVLFTAIKNAVFYFFCKKCKSEFVFEEGGVAYFLSASMDFQYPVFSNLFTFSVRLVNRKEI
jgi:hypothetical protein